MPLYLSKFSYTPETWARLVDSPEDRAEAARSYIESVGGKLHGFRVRLRLARRLQPVGSTRQRLDGCGGSGDQRGRSACLSGDHGSGERRRNHRGARQSEADPVPSPRDLEVSHSLRKDVGQEKSAL